MTHELNKVKNALYLGLFASIVGILDSAFILWSHDMGRMEGMCSASGMISCLALQHPQYSRLFGIPLSVYGLLFYGFVFLYQLFCIKKAIFTRIRNEAKVLFALSAFAMLPTVYLFLISVFKLKSLCPYCMVLYAVSILFLVSASILRKHIPKDKGELEPSAPPFAMWMGLYAFIALIVLALTPSVLKKKTTLSGAVGVFSSDAGRTMGAPSSPHTIVKFSDFQCPMCKHVAQVLKDLEKKDRGKVKIVYKFYPLDSSCNRGIKRKMHPEACMAANAAQCASLQGLFWPYHDLIFENQESLSESVFLEFAKMLNMNIDQFKACLKDPRTREAVGSDIQEGEAQAISGTPTLFIDGRAYHGEMNVESLSNALSTDSGSSGDSSR